MRAKLRAAAGELIFKICGLRLRYRIVLLIVVGCVLWFLSGLFSNRDDGREEAIFGTVDLDAIVDVRKLHSELRRITRLLPAQVHADKSVMIVSEVSGKVEEIFLTAGSFVKHNEAVLKIEERDKLEQLERAEKLLKLRRLEREASDSLRVAGYRAKMQSHSALVALKEAEVNYKNALLDYENTTIKAPFSGLVDEIFPQVGSMVSIGQQVARIANFDKLKVVAYVSEDDVSYIKFGDSAEIILGREGKVLPGQVNFIGRTVSMETKSCRLEILVDNIDMHEYIADGMSAKVRLSVRDVKAYKIPASSLSVDSDGNMGIKLLDDGGIVKFLKVDIVDDEAGYVWISGIHDNEIMLIIHGHEYAVNGAIIARYNT